MKRHKIKFSRVLNREIRNQQGSALAYALIIMTIVSIILVSILQYISAQIKFSFNRVYREQSFQIAESGIQFYKWYLNRETDGKTTEEVQEFWQNSPSPYGVDEPYEQEYFDPEGSAFGKFSIEVQAPDIGSTRAIVKSIGWTYRNPDVKRIVQARFRRPALCEYAVVVNDAIHFGQNTEIYGPIHSNYGIRFDGIAHNLISSSVYQYDDPEHNGENEFGVHTHVKPPPNNDQIDPNIVPAEAPPSVLADRPDVFGGGRSLSEPIIDFNAMVVDLNFMKQEATTGNGLYYNNAACDGKTNLGRHIKINGNTMTITTVTELNASHNTIKKEGCATNVSIPQNGIVFVENNIWLEGQINDRRVTFVAANLSGGEKASVYLGMNNLLYTEHDGQDIIGVIAQLDVEIVDDAPDNLTIEAAILSQSSAVTKNHKPFLCGSETCEDKKDTITIYGSLASFLRYGFYFSDGSGYQNRILKFDNNLLYYQPPYFPTLNTYQIDLWQEL